jgi:hypothetical protein
VFRAWAACAGSYFAIDSTAGAAERCISYMVRNTCAYQGSNSRPASSAKSAGQLLPRRGRCTACNRLLSSACAHRCCSMRSVRAIAVLHLADFLHSPARCVAAAACLQRFSVPHGHLSRASGIWSVPPVRPSRLPRIPSLHWYVYMFPGALPGKLGCARARDWRHH